MKDVMRFWKTGELDPSSNVPFGEGGAGTFSDGKLTTQIKDRDNRCRKVLEELVVAGAPDEILFINKPHIGTDILVKVVSNLRERIISLGGEVCFGSQVTDIMIDDGCVRGVVLADGQELCSGNISRLDPGQTYDLSIRGDLIGKGLRENQTYYLFVFVDSVGEIEESDETNNEAKDN